MRLCMWLNLALRRPSSSLLVTGTRARKLPFSTSSMASDMRRMGADTVRATTKAKTMPVRQAISSTGSTACAAEWRTAPNSCVETPATTA